MLDDDDVPPEGVFTDQWLWGRRAKVWWQREVMLAFPRVEDRLPILQALEDAMIHYGRTVFYYHLERIGPHYVTYATADDDQFIYVETRLGAPIEVQLPDELLAKADPD